MQLQDEIISHGKLHAPALCLAVSRANFYFLTPPPILRGYYFFASCYFLLPFATL